MSEGTCRQGFWINLSTTAELQIVRRRKSQGVYLCLRVRADRAFWKNLMQNYKSSESYYTTRVSRGVPVHGGSCTQAGLVDKHNDNKQQKYNSSNSNYTTRVSRGVPVSEDMCTQGFLEKPNAELQIL